MLGDAAWVGIFSFVFCALLGAWASKGRTGTATLVVFPVVAGGAVLMMSGPLHQARRRLIGAAVCLLGIGLHAAAMWWWTRRNPRSRDWKASMDLVAFGTGLAVVAGFVAAAGLWWYVSS